MKEYYNTKFGKYFIGDSVKALQNEILRKYKNKIQLIITSPPFPLNTKKKYGNLNGKEYIKWFSDLAFIFSELLTDSGSIVIEIGNSWEPNRPVQSLLHLESLLKFVKNPKAKLKLIQEFICYNPSKLPSPAQWVTVNRIRTVDSYTHAWWISKTDFPKADNRNVLKPYSESMLKLLKDQKFNDGKRPSEHNISKGAFLKDNGGSIMHNLIELEQIDNMREIRLPSNVQSYANTISNDFFLKTCREKKIKPHPARMSQGLVSFFIQFLTEKNDIVLDPFAGSNTTGFCAEKLDRKWLGIEINKEYAEQSIIRFKDPKLKTKVHKGKL